MSEPTMDSFVRNCSLQLRDPDEVLFEAYTDASGQLVWRARLDGYAILPMEVYEAMKGNAS